jgi:hypothetical protein
MSPLFPRATELEKLVESVKLQAPFKDTLAQGDLVVMIRDSSPSPKLDFAQINALTRSVERGRPRLRLRLTILSLPVSCRTLILPDSERPREFYDHRGQRLFIKALNTDAFGELPRRGRRAIRADDVLERVISRPSDFDEDPLSAETRPDASSLPERKPTLTLVKLFSLEQAKKNDG